MENPKSAIAEILEFADLEEDTEIERFISTRVKFKNMNLQFLDNFSRADLDMLENLPGDLLLELGYSSSAAR